MKPEYEQLSAMLIRHEGMKLKVYQDTVGKMTIGAGRNLDDVGISEDEALILLENDIDRAEKAALKFGWFEHMTYARHDVVVSMIYNMGVERFKGFKKLIACLDNGDYVGAASEMLSSQWSAQVGRRSVELAQMMRSGVYAGA